MTVDHSEVDDLLRRILGCRAAEFVFRANRIFLEFEHTAIELTDAEAAYLGRLMAE